MPVERSFRSGDALIARLGIGHFVCGMSVLARFRSRVTSILQQVSYGEAYGATYVKRDPRGFPRARYFGEVALC